LQPLYGGRLRPDHQLGPGQPRKGLVPVAGEQQALQIGPEALALRQHAEQIIKLPRAG
jgi:hypothetical protein